MKTKERRMVPFLLKAIPERGDPIYKLLKWPVVPRKGETVKLPDVMSGQENFMVEDVVHDFGGENMFETLEVEIRITRELAKLLLKEPGWKEDISEFSDIWPSQYNKA